MTPEQIAKLQLENETVKARADKAESDLKALQVKLDAANGENAVNKARADKAEGDLKTRADADELASVSAVAAKSIKDFKADGKTVEQIKREVIAARFPELKLDAAQLDGAFLAASAVKADDSASARSAVRPLPTERKDAKPGASTATSNWRFAKPATK